MIHRHINKQYYNQRLLKRIFILKIGTNVKDNFLFYSHTRLNFLNITLRLAVFESTINL
jgi:hypothetical protein